METTSDIEPELREAISFRVIRVLGHTVVIDENGVSKAASIHCVAAAFWEDCNNYAAKPGPG